MGLILVIVTGVIASLIANELLAWAPRLSRLLLRRAIKRLPEDLRPRYDEEWNAELQHIPGRLGQVAFALGAQRAASTLLKSENHQNVSDAVDWLIREARDRIVAGALIFLQIPLLSLLALFVWLGGPGPIFVRRKFYCVSGKDIFLLKFRTFRFLDYDAQRVFKNPPITTENLIPFGRFMRYTRLDNLPILFNLVRGDIRLFGPRLMHIQNQANALAKGGKQGRQIVKSGLFANWRTLVRTLLISEE